MNLESASTWLERQHVGFSEMQRFASQCRDAASESGRESAALVLLAERAITFYERHEGAAVSTVVVDEFLSELRQDALRLKDASKNSDAAVYIDALNIIASKLAPTLVV